MSQKRKTKEEIVAEYLTGNYSYRELGLKYDIPFRSICDWVMEYQGRKPIWREKMKRKLEKETGIEESELPNEVKILKKEQQTIPALQSSFDFLGGQIPILKILQHSSTLPGGLVIAFSIYKLPANKTENENVNWKYWAIVAGLTLTIISIRLLSGLYIIQYGNVIVTAISAGLISLTITPLLTRTKEE